MSHELRTPMNAILGFAQLMEMGDPTPTQREYLGYVLAGGRHLLELINEVLDIARIESGRLPLSLEPVAVADVLREALDMMRPQADGRRVRLPAGPPPSSPAFVLADRQRLRQVVLNLLSNAVKYNRPGGEVWLACEATATGQIQIGVGDTGPGIPPEALPRLFTPFERLDADQRGIEGTGLGLVLAQRLIEAMGGRIGVNSHPGEGSTFWVLLDAAAAPATALAPLQAPASGAPVSGPHRTILYIEDNLSNLQLIEHLLDQEPAVTVLPSMQGQLGIELAREHRPDLILLDLHLPDLPGSEVLQRLQADPTTRDIPVVVISADATEHQRARLLAAGARAYLTKPIDVARTLAVLHELLTAPAAADPPAAD